MTLYSILFALPVFFAFLWPTITLLFKRKVMVAQGLMMGTFLLIGVSMALYSCYFNKFLQYEHLLSYLYTILSLFSPPMFYISICSFTNIHGVERTDRAIFLPSIIVAMLITINSLILGFDGCALFLERAVHEGNHTFIPGFWAYNSMVVISYYVFLLTLVCEVIFVASYSIHKVSRYNKLIEEHYANPIKFHLFVSKIFPVCGFLIVLVALVLGAFPLHTLHSLFVVVVISLIEIIVFVLLGYYFYTIPYGAQQLAANIHETNLRYEAFTKRTKSAVEKKFEIMVLIDYVENQKAYLQKDLSVASLATRFKVTQNTIIDAVHAYRGVSFFDYINSLRIEYAISLLLQHTVGKIDNDYLEIVAFDCGYLSLSSFEVAFSKVMNMSLYTWLETE